MRSTSADLGRNPTGRPTCSEQGATQRGAAPEPTTEPTDGPAITPPSPIIPPSEEPDAPDMPGVPGGAEEDEAAWVAGKGFDTCTAPSLASMRAWRSSFTVTNMYIGGAARGCAQPNLTKDWVREVRGMGYRITPTYVGLQAPCGY